jgi:ubiquinone/menaquinone biosynthesis C-methylase UbiE
MRVVDLDRDMRDVIPTGTTRDSEFLFDRMTERTLALTRPAPGGRILDVASGFGQDAAALAEQGAWVVGAEPSARMTALGCMQSRKRNGAQPTWVRGWADGLPFASGSFDAVICKGAIDHFDRPTRALAEMARVTKPDGWVVLAIANFESLACRLARASDSLREDWLGRPVPRGRRHYDVPNDHFTRYELDLMREQLSAVTHLEVVEGISLAWGMPGWTRWVGRLPAATAQRSLETLDWVARRVPSLADVVVLAGRPRQSPTTSS